MKKNRILKRIQEKKAKKQKLFCAFVTLGYPNLSGTEKLIRKFDQTSVDIIELGYPFSDPLADGPTIQYSSEQALKKGVKIKDAFRLCSKLRKSGCQVPIIFFTYLNPIYHFGLRRFVAEAAKVGIDGLIVPDLPPEEEIDLQKHCKKKGLAQIFLIAPTTRPERMKKIARSARGFIYYVSLRGVTGARSRLPTDLKQSIKRVRQKAKMPVLIGFGVSNPKQGKALSEYSDGVIVGSGIMDRIRKSKGRLEPAIRYVTSMVNSVKKKK